MTNKATKKTTRKTPPAEGGSVETCRAPAPPSKGKIIGLDCHPDTFTAAVFIGQTPHDARKIGSHENLSMEAMLHWAAAELTGPDLILLEAGSNSFEVSRRLGALGLRACVMESCHVGKHAKTCADYDKLAAALGQWGWKLFQRKGQRNIAVAAVARKLLVQVWHMLQGHVPKALESDKTFKTKINKLAVSLGTALRQQLDLGCSLQECVSLLAQRAGLRPAEPAS